MGEQWWQLLLRENSPCDSLLSLLKTRIGALVLEVENPVDFCTGFATLMAKQNSAKEESSRRGRRGDKCMISFCKTPGASTQKNDGNGKDRSVTGLKCPVPACPGSHGMAFEPSCPLPFETSSLLSLNFATSTPAHQNFISHLLDLLGLCLDVVLQSVLSTLHGL